MTKYKPTGNLFRIPLLSVVLVLCYSLAFAQNDKIADALNALTAENLDEAKGLIDAAAEKERLRQERDEETAERRARLRGKSESIFNALYGR